MKSALDPSPPLWVIRSRKIGCVPGSGSRARGFGLARVYDERFVAFNVASPTAGRCAGCKDLQRDRFRAGLRLDSALDMIETFTRSDTSGALS